MGYSGVLGAGGLGMVAAMLVAAGGRGDAGPQATAARASAVAKPGPANGLSPMARVLLQGRMRRHVDDMAYLTRAVVLLQYPRIEEAVALVADEPSLARPLGRDDALNEALPQRFFTLEETLHREATALREAARAKDDAAIGERFGKLAQTCVQCHAEFLERR